MANRWLVKTEPRLFTFDDLLERRVVTWRGVTQPLSRKHLARMRRGDDVLVYHAGSQRAVVGTARVRKGAYPDAQADDPALLAVDLATPEALVRPVRLTELRSERALADWELLRIPRIHVLPVPARAWRRVLALARRPAP